MYQSERPVMTNGPARAFHLPIRSKKSQSRLRVAAEKPKCLRLQEVPCQKEELEPEIKK